MRIIEDFIAGRYEAGKENNKVVVKKDKPVYNYITWANSRTVLTGGAAELAKKFVDTTYTDNGKTVGVKSSLIYGIQWDATMQFFDNNYIGETCASDSYIRNSIGKGWYENNSGKMIHNTGIDVDVNASNKIKNIYDMAGNVAEWTMEGHHAGHRIYRGGTYNEKYPVSFRMINSMDYTYKWVGFRIALYF